jgi:hypothetical protein
MNHTRQEGNCVQLCKSQLLNGPATAANKQPREDLLLDRLAHEKRGDCKSWNGVNDRVSSCEEPHKISAKAWTQTSRHCAFCWMDPSYVKQQLQERRINLRDYGVYVATDGQLPLQAKALVDELGAVGVGDAFLENALPGSVQEQMLLQVSIDLLMLAMSDTLLFPPVSTFSVMVERLRYALGSAANDTDASNFMPIDV